MDEGGDNMKNFDQNAYNREKYRAFIIRVDRVKDPDVIQRLEASGNVSAYVRDLVKGALKDGNEKKQV